MADRGLTIGKLASTAGCNVQTVRYYERIGLMPAPLRTLGNHRLYGADHVNRLAFIRHARELGLSIEVVRELLTLSDKPNQPCAAVDHIVRQQLQLIRHRIGRLLSVQREFKRMLSDRRHGNIKHCRVLEVLADHTHAKCLDPLHAGTNAN